MKIKKKYAIRKLAVGVASVSIGLFVANSVDNQFGSNISLLKNNSGVVHAACNLQNYYFLNHYDEYETVYEADGTLAKGEHKVAREVNEGRQLFKIVPINCSYEPYTALGDDELFHKPYEVITNKSNIAKEYELKTLDNNKKDHRTEEDDKEEAKLWDRYMNSPGEFFFETRTRKKVLLNKDENVTEPINNEDGSITIPSHSVSKKYKNRKDEMKEFSIGTIDENYLNKEHDYDDNVYIRNTYNKYVKDYFKLVKVGNVERIPISTIAIETDYVANNTLAYGVRNTTNQGKEGLRENVVTYEVDRNTGDLKNPTIVENTIPMEKKIVEVGTKEKVVYSKKGNDVIKTTTTYELNTTTGEVTPHDNEEVVKTGEVKDKVEYLKVGNDVVKRTTTYKVNPENGEITPEVKDEVVKTGEAKDKVEYLKVDNDVVKRTTTYRVNQETGEITPEVKDEIIKVGEVKDKVEVEKIPSPIRYEKDDSREKGQENITVQGRDGSKTTTTTYTVDENTGDITSQPQEPVIVEPTNTIIKVALKDKVEIVNKKDGSVVKETTLYTINEKTGEITKTKTEEVIKSKVETSKGEDTPPVVNNLSEFTGGVNPNESPVMENNDFVGGVNSIDTPVVDNKDFVGEINPVDNPVVEELPELKVVIIKDNKGSILEVIKENEKPKEIKGYKNTGKVEIDKNGYKVYIYEKVEDKQDSLVDKNKETNEPITKEKATIEENKDNNKETISKKEELPKTNASFFSGLGLLAGFSLLRRKKDKQ